MMNARMNILAKNLLILASAGSGKTFQLGNRVIGLVAAGVAPEKIVALTFTRKAAGEFTDSVLTKLAAAATQEKEATSLRKAIANDDADFTESLERVVRALPRFTLGTMDSFFAKVVRGFQYELGLTGGKFELLEGSQAVVAADEILAAILSTALDDSAGEDFLHAFRRANIGKEEQSVAEGLRGFVKGWQSRFRSSAGLEWGPAGLAGVNLDEWEKQKHGLADVVARGLDGIDYTRKGQREALEAVLGVFREHTIGSGSLGGATGLLANILSAAAKTNGPLEVKYYKEFLIGGPAGDALRDLVNLAARCEMAAATHRTRAVREVVSVYDARCDTQLRRRGLLGFDDIKSLMGNWSSGEEARLRREAVDFRLDSRHEHWLLDEFQDTSRADWMGLLPLIDEAASNETSSMFIVGDRKQAIYAWRGGEVGLFDEIITRYQGGLDISPMSRSFRSCPEVLALVNRVCGDTSTIRELFGDAANAWQWDEHSPADSLATHEKRGEARVEVVPGKWEERLERLGNLLEEIGIGTRPVTCGVLVRGNALVREISDDLRAKGFDVIEEGAREPAKDNPVGIALLHLLRWLANPADMYAREVISMSPLLAVLEERFPEGWYHRWERLLEESSEAGFAAMVNHLIAGLSHEWSDFGRRRAGDIIAALGAFDTHGGGTAREAAEWIERLEISQNPGVAAVQVMTIHKAKGLGFDVVILPDIPNDSVPATQHFTIAEGDGWITQTPPKWARELIPEMREAEQRWAAAQRYEALCLLYVALTRSKRALHVLLEPPSASQEADRPSLANWIFRSIEADGATGVVFQSGTPDWIESLPAANSSKEKPEAISLPAPTARRVRISPAGLGAGSRSHHQTSGRQFGSEVHSVLENVGWIDELAPVLPKSAAGKLVAELLQIQSIRELFLVRGEDVQLLREQPLDAIIGGNWISGVVDRIHLHHAPSGSVTRVQLIDFKTDEVESITELAGRHGAQMEAYRSILTRAYPEAKIECVLVSTHCRELTYLSPETA